MRKIYFDEAGNSGNNLLDKEQPLFCYLGFEDCDSNTIEDFYSLKRKYKYKTDLEVKGASLSKSVTGQKFLIELWEKFGTHVKFVMHDKKFALACKMFEYVFEPVFCDVNTLFYQINFHKYIAISMYNLFTNSNHSAEQLFTNFYAFIKNKGDKSFNEYVTSCGIVKTSPLFYFCDFCNQHKTEIASDIDFTDKQDKYILDLTLTSLYNLLGVFSHGSPESMEVHCDNSKQIANEKGFWKAFINNTNIVYDTYFYSGAQLTFNITQEPILEDSKEIIQLQISDLLASSVYQAYLHPETDFSKTIKKISQTAYVEAYSVAPVELEFTFDEFEIKQFNKIIKLLASENSKVKKIEKLAEISYELTCYQKFRDKMFIDFIKNFKLNK